MRGDRLSTEQRLTRMVLGEAGRDPGELFAADLEFCFLDTPDCFVEGGPGDVLIDRTTQPCNLVRGHFVVATTDEKPCCRNVKVTPAVGEPDTLMILVRLLVLAESHIAIRPEELGSAEFVGQLENQCLDRCFD